MVMSEALGFSTFPDVETMVMHILRTEINPEFGVHSSVPRNYTGGPMVLVARGGGVPAHRAALDAADIDFQVYGVNKTEARLLAQRCRLEVWKKMGTRVTHPRGMTGWISGVADLDGIQYNPDPTDPPRDRYTFGLTLFTKE
jgi:hypothetical protein